MYSRQYAGSKTFLPIISETRHRIEILTTLLPYNSDSSFPVTIMTVWRVLRYDHCVYVRARCQPARLLTMPDRFHRVNITILKYERLEPNSGSIVVQIK